MTTNREELKRLALAANPGPHHIYTNPRDDNNWQANYAFQKEVSPDVVLSLLADLERAEAELKKIRDLELDVRGKLAAQLKCWHRLTGVEAEELVALYTAPVAQQGCTCPSGDGSLRWPCPVHPPEAA